MGHVLEEIVSSRLKESQCARGATIVGVEFCRISSAGRWFMGLVGLLALVCVATSGQQAFAEDVVQEDQRLIALDQKFHADYGGSIQLWKSGDDKLADLPHLCAATRRRPAINPAVPHMHRFADGRRRPRQRSARPSTLGDLPLPAVAEAGRPVTARRRCV